MQVPQVQLVEKLVEVMFCSTWLLSVGVEFRRVFSFPMGGKPAFQVSTFRTQRVNVYSNGHVIIVTTFAMCCSRCVSQVPKVEIQERLHHVPKWPWHVLHFFALSSAHSHAWCS